MILIEQSSELVFVHPQILELLLEYWVHLEFPRYLQSIFQFLLLFLFGRLVNVTGDVDSSIFLFLFFRGVSSSRFRFMQSDVCVKFIKRMHMATFEKRCFSSNTNEPIL